jgi:DNA excision repair protein ERCC-5
MGVKGLWNLLLPIGRRISIETLEGKILAVDASIWMIQFIKAMRDTEGKVIPNAHLIGFLRRICRLLYHGIRPVIVFDGKTPQIKLREIQRRRREMRREGAPISEEEQHAAAIRMAKRILLTQLKNSKKRKANYDDHDIDQTNSNSSNVNGAFASGFFMEDRNHLHNTAIASSEAHGNNTEDGFDIGNNNRNLEGERNPLNNLHFMPPDTTQKYSIDNTTADDYAIAYTLQQEEYGVEEGESQKILAEKFNTPKVPEVAVADDDYLDNNDSVSVNSSYSVNEASSLSDIRNEGDLPELSTILSLPPSQRKDIFEKAQRQQRLSARKQYLPVAADPQKYSQCQLSNFLQSSRLNQRITIMSSSLQKRGNELIGEAIASDSTRRIVFTKNTLEVNKLRANTEMQMLSHKSSPKLNRLQRQPITIVHKKETHVDSGDEFPEMRQNHLQRRLRQRRIIESNDFEDEVNDMSDTELLIVNKSSSSLGSNEENQMFKNRLPGSMENMNNKYCYDGGFLEETSNHSVPCYPSNSHSMEHHRKSTSNKNFIDEGGGGFILEDSTILLTGSHTQDRLEQHATLAVSPQHNCENMTHNQSQMIDLVKSDRNWSIRDKTPVDQTIRCTLAGEEFDNMHNDKLDMPRGIKCNDTPIRIGGISSNWKMNDMISAPCAVNCKDSSIARKTTQPKSHTESLDSDAQLDWEDGMNGTGVQQSLTVEVDEEIINPLVKCKDSFVANETTQPILQSDSVNSDNEIDWEEGMKGVQQIPSVKVDEEINDPLIKCKGSIVANKTTQPNIQSESLNSDSEIDWEDGIHDSGVKQSPPVEEDEEIDDPLVKCKDSFIANERREPNIQSESLNSDNEIDWEDGINDSRATQSPPEEVNEEIDDPFSQSSKTTGCFFPHSPATEILTDKLCQSAYVPDDNSNVKSSQQETFFTDNATAAALVQAQATASNLTNWAGRAVRRAIEEHMGKPLTGIDNEVSSRISLPVAALDDDAISGNDDDLERADDKNTLPKDSFNQDASLEFLEHEDEELRQEQNRQQRDMDAVTESMKEDIVQLLLLFGIPYVDAPAEAEAQCVALEKLGLVDGIVTEDSDVFVFGGENIYRNIFDEMKFVELYLARDAKMELGLSSNDFIALAMLLGSDYTSGVKGVGIVNGMEILQAFPVQDNLLEGLEKFRTWLDGMGWIQEKYIRLQH